ncbi:MAG: M81 family metallopeptidase [Oligella ureolytica]|nr:M81 family metallopeptidase [Oligella ureolytica]
MARIVYGCFLHETNTFAPDLADWAAFEAGGGWPGLAFDEQVWPAIQGCNISAAGFVEKALEEGHELIPTVWAAASPSAHVEEETYERITQKILQGIKQSLPVDAVYLDLHGAMVVQHFDDGEGELIERVRKIVGPQIPIAVTLDLHANVTSKMLSEADVLVAYRTYPHVDMAETGERCYKLLMRQLTKSKRQHVAVRRLPFLVPICWQCTDIEPAKSLYGLLEKTETADTHLSFATGFPAADFPECSPVIWAYADSEKEANELVDVLAKAAEEAEKEFAGKLYTPDEAVQYAMAKAKVVRKPIVIADAQDNPGAGSNSDSTGMLKALVANNAQNAAIGLIVDPESAEAAVSAGEGVTIHLSLGGKSGVAGDSPFEADFLVEKVSDGKAKADGPYYRNRLLEMGKSACLRIGGVQVVVASQKIQMADRVMFSFVGIDPLTADILVVKSAVHFRADFTPLAEEIIVAKAPGSMPMVLEELPWTNLKEGIRIDPCGKVFSK